MKTKVFLINESGTQCVGTADVPEFVLQYIADNIPCDYSYSTEITGRTARQLIKKLFPIKRKYTYKTLRKDCKKTRRG